MLYHSELRPFARACAAGFIGAVKGVCTSLWYQAHLYGGSQTVDRLKTGSEEQKAHMD